MSRWGRFSVKKKDAVFLLILVFLSVCYLLGSCNKNSQDRIILNLAETFGSESIITKADYLFADMVNEKTDGRILINIHPNGELGNEKQALGLVKTNSIDIARVNATALASDSNLIEIFHTPFLFDNKEQLFNALDSKLGDSIKKELSENNLTILCNYYSGERDFCFTTRNVTKSHNFKAKRIRVNNDDTNLTYLNLLEANPVPLDFSEIYSAFEANMIDGAEINAIIFEDKNIIDFSNSILRLEYKRVPDYMVINSNVFNSLTEEDQKILLDCAKQAQEYELENWDNYQTNLLNRLEEKGCSILYPNETELADFKTKSQPIYDTMNNEILKKFDLIV